jgi:hypothetical protein
MTSRCDPSRWRGYPSGQRNWSGSSLLDARRSEISTWKIHLTRAHYARLHTDSSTADLSVAFTSLQRRRWIPRMPLLFISALEWRASLVKSVTPQRVSAELLDRSRSYRTMRRHRLGLSRGYIRHSVVRCIAMHAVMVHQVRHLAATDYETLRAGASTRANGHSR